MAANRRGQYCTFPEDICKERVALDLPCQDDEECVAGAYCDKTSKTCTASRAVGEACAVNAECETRDCTNQKCAAGNDLAITLLCGTN